MSITRTFPILAIVLSLAAPLSATAQTTASPAPDASSAPMTQGHHYRHHRQSFMHQLQALNLTDAQKQQVAAFHSQEVQANKNADSSTKRANAMKMRSQVMGILTPDQKVQMTSHMHHSGHMSAANGAQTPNMTGSPMPAPSESPAH